MDHRENREGQLRVGSSKLDLLLHSPRQFFVRATHRLADLLLLALSPSARRHYEVGFAVGWKANRDSQLPFLQKAGLRSGSYLLDLGCGTLRGGIPIIEFLQEGHYYGVEARANVVEMARTELREHKLEHKAPELINEEDLSSLEIGRKFDFIWAHSVLIHMTDEIMNGCLDCVSRHLGASGLFYANVQLNEGSEQADGTWKRFPLVARSLQFYSQAASRNGLSCEVVSPWGGHTMLLFRLAG